MNTAPDLATLLRRIATELAARASDVEALGELVPLLPPLGAALQRRAQSIDSLAQELGELGTLLGGLADGAPEADVPIRLVEAVRLSDLAERLRGREGRPLDPPGDLDLF